MARDEKLYEQVGDIKIKEPKVKKSKKKKRNSDTPLGTKIFVWFMFIAMLASFAVPLIMYFVSLISE